ncbi:GPI-anchor transamidase [Takifugu flavidus]|uniref:GPI-anchor transamidase n=1 Tax=Takifugu flavidus TaxID=433684 RepID=A0A5C6P1A9_9TELE|nr:GPI-anchor transamidase [Takifugu flavidus]
MREPPEKALSALPLRTPKRVDTLNNSQDLSPHPKAKESYPLIHRGKLQYSGTELGSNENCHPCPLPLTIGNSRVKPNQKDWHPPDGFILGLWTLILLVFFKTYGMKQLKHIF